MVHTYADGCLPGKRVNQRALSSFTGGAKQFPAAITLGARPPRESAGVHMCSIISKFVCAVFLINGRMHVYAYVYVYGCMCLGAPLHLHDNRCAKAFSAADAYIFQRVVVVGVISENPAHTCELSGAPNSRRYAIFQSHAGTHTKASTYMKIYI